MDIKKIEACVQRLRITRRWKELALNLFFIRRGIKPGFLWDLGNINVSGLLELKIVLPDILVLHIAGDYFVSSRECFHKHLHTLTLNFPTIIDITNKLEKPKIATTVIEHKVQEDLRSLVSQICDEDRTDISLGLDMNVTTLFGLMLGYPVVYYYDTKIQGNCLSNRDLTVYKVGSDNVWPISFSVPTNLSTQTSISTWLENLRTSFEDLDIKLENVNLSTIAM